MLDLPGFSRFNLEGEGAAEFLRGLVAGGLPKVGRMNLVYISDNRGRILTEMSCIRHGEDHFTLITAGSAQWHDFEILRKALPAGLSLTDHTTEYGTMIVTGPKSRELFASLSDADLSLGWRASRPSSPGSPLLANWAGRCIAPTRTSRRSMPRSWKRALPLSACMR